MCPGNLRAIPVLPSDRGLLLHFGHKLPTSAQPYTELCFHFSVLTVEGKDLNELLENIKQNKLPNINQILKIIIICISNFL